jgi:ATP-dependent Lon protease
MDDTSKKLPIVALRGMSVLPGMLIHFDISRKITIAAVEDAMLKDQQIFLVTQRDGKIELPQQQDLYEVGTTAIIKQMIRLPENMVRVMAVGKERASLNKMIETQDFLFGEVDIYQDNSLEDISEIEKVAMLRNMKELITSYAVENEKMGKTGLQQLLDISDLNKLIDEIAINISMTLEEKQSIINELQFVSRYERILIILAQEIEIMRFRKAFQAKVKAKVDHNQREYLLREQLKVIREELGESNTVNDAEQYVKAVKSLKASKEVKDKIKSEIERFKNITSNSSESSVIRGYIETLLALPWNKSSKENYDLKNAAIILDKDHYGLTKVKERILEFLAVRTLTKKGDSPIICLVGPPGTGKTSIAKSVAEALGKKYIRVSLGGVRDEAEIRGHRRTYVGAMPGRIATGLIHAGVKNPLLLLDEIDKSSGDYKGDISSALLEVLDSGQNNKFGDHYVELPIDLSEVLFITTANTIQTIPRPLLDRMEIIQVSSYTENEKIHIAQEHLITKQMKKNGLKEDWLSISYNALDKIVLGYTKEAGVRNLERKIGEICRKAAREILEGNKKQVKITERNLDKYLGNVRFSYEPANEENQVGIVRGLAWTSVGGDTLQIEVNVMPGKGKFELTGQLGDVMKESAKTGISYIRSVSEQYQIEREFFEKHDIHIHIPEGAVPKDGPSAGITMATAMISAITKKRVRADIAMTGEITLRGRVLPIGGLKEKILAAKTAKIKMVLVPKKNEKDIDEIEKEILDGIKIVYVDMMEEVLTYALA